MEAAQQFALNQGSCCHDCPAYDTPLQGDCGTFTIAMWNICNGQNGGLKAAVRAMDQMGVTLAVMVKRKVTGGVHT